MKDERARETELLRKKHDSWSGKCDVSRQAIVAMCLHLNCLVFGLGVNWPSPVMVKLSSASQTVLPQVLDSLDTSWIVSITFITGSVGYLMACGLIDLIGRKCCVILSSVAAMAAGLLYLFATDVWMLILGRAMIGLQEGLLLGVVPVYASEIATKEIRGALGVMLQIFSSAGSLIMLSVGPVTSYFNLNLMMCIFTLVASIPTFFLPDSPVYLYSRGRHEQSKRVLTFLRGSELLAIEEIQEYSRNTNDDSFSILNTLRSKVFLNCFGKSVFIVICVYLTGFNCVVSYLQTILVASKTNIKSEVASGIIGGIQLLASFSSMLFTDKCGRKPILVSTLFGMTVGMVGLGTFFKLTAMGTTVSGFLNFLPLLSLMVVVFCYSAGLGSLLWPLIAELYDDGSRGIGVPTALLIGTVPSFLTVRYFSTLIDSIGAAPTFWISAAVCVVLALFIAFRVPETKGKSFAEIQLALGNREKC